MLWLLGRVRKLKGEAADADTERRIALAGSATSVALAMGFFVLSRIFGAGHTASPAAAVFGWLGWVNGLLAVFNLLPAFSSTRGGSCGRSCGVAMVTGGGLPRPQHGPVAPLAMP